MDICSSECRAECRKIVKTELAKSGWVPAPKAPFVGYDLWRMVEQAQQFEDPPAHDFARYLPYGPVRSPGVTGENIPGGAFSCCRHPEPGSLLASFRRSFLVRFVSAPVGPLSALGVAPVVT